MKVYFIPGLGADKRVFKHIQLPDSYEIVHLHWKQPEKNESLKSYAVRMCDQIDQEEPWALVGLSFGGMLAAEISKQFSPSKTILIASIGSSNDLPPYFKIAAPLQLHKLLPISLFKNASLAKRIFTTETKEDKELLKRIIRESDPGFIKWALGAILGWEKSDSPDNIIHIHGSSDRLLPLRYVHATHTIKGGGHLMVMNRSEEINHLLAEIFAA